MICLPIFDIPYRYHLPMIELHWQIIASWINLLLQSSFERVCLRIPTNSEHDNSFVNYNLNSISYRFSALTISLFQLLQSTANVTLLFYSCWIAFKDTLSLMFTYTGVSGNLWHLFCTCTDRLRRQTLCWRLYCCIRYFSSNIPSSFKFQ